jgi:hypothetical protein
VTPLALDPDRWPELSECDGALRWLARTAGPAFNVERRIGNLEAYTGMLPARLARFRERSDRTALASSGALWGFGAVVIPGGADPAARPGLQGLGAAVGSDPELPALVLSQPARPRVGLAGELARADAAGALEFALSQGAAPSGRSVVEGALPAGYAPPAGEARLVSDEGERLLVEARADRPALLVVNDTNAPGWSATVDGRAAPIVAVNYLARGIWLPAGAHAVELRYRTPWLREGAALAALTLLALLGLWVLRGRGGRERGRGQGSAS